MADRRKQKRTSRLSVVISVVFHAALIGGLAFIAAREGILGKELKKIAVTMVPKEKPPEEKPKEKPPEEKPIEKPPEKPPVEEPPVVAATTPPPVAPTVSAPPAGAGEGGVGAPAAAQLPAFDFEGGRPTGGGGTGPAGIYKGYVEYSLRSNWQRPENVDDANFVAEVEVSVDGTGQIMNAEVKRGSGNVAWDNSVRDAMARTKNIGRKPPKGFPEKVLVRFDVQPVQEIGIE